MLSIGKTTYKMAKARGFDLTLEEGIREDGHLELCVWEAGNDCEWLFSYHHTGHQLIWSGNVYAPAHVIAALDKVLDSEEELRHMLCLLEVLMKSSSAAVKDEMPGRNSRISKRRSKSVVRRVTDAVKLQMGAVMGLSAYSSLSHSQDESALSEAGDDTWFPRQPNAQETMMLNIAMGMPELGATRVFR